MEAELGQYILQTHKSKKIPKIHLGEGFEPFQSQLSLPPVLLWLSKVCLCMQPVLISEDDVQKQEQKVTEARRRLQHAMLLVSNTTSNADVP